MSGHEYKSYAFRVSFSVSPAGLESMNVRHSVVHTTGKDVSPSGLPEHSPLRIEEVTLPIRHAEEPLG